MIIVFFGIVGASQFEIWLGRCVLQSNKRRMKAFSQTVRSQSIQISLDITKITVGLDQGLLISAFLFF